MENYHDFIDTLTNAIAEAKKLPLAAARSRAQPALPEKTPRVAIFSPHPDDECIIGALPLRLLRQNRVKIFNIAVTQGSRKDRQAPRFQELRRACEYLGFEVVQTRPGGLEKIKPETRQQESDYWRECVQVIVDIMQNLAPDIIFVPHKDDWNSTHIGTHYLIMDALGAMPDTFSCTVIETEYWQPMPDPNWMVECRPELLADLITGLTFHEGEVARNPYHLALPAWMQDNVRRGSELVGGQGEAAPDFLFATLYRVSRWRNGEMAPLPPSPGILAADDCCSIDCLNHDC